MSVIRRVLGHKEQREANFSLPARGIGPNTIAGVTNPDQAMRHSAYWAAVNRIVDPISTMPVDRYDSPGGVARKLTGTTIIEDPATLTDPMSWARQVLVSWLTEGNVFALPESYDNLMRPRYLRILEPSLMRAKVSRDTGALEWYCNGQPVPDVIHRSAYTVPGVPIGLSPLQYAARTLGLGLSAEEFGLRWFVDGTHPSALLRTDNVLDAEKAQIVKERWKASVANTREPVVLGGGWTYDAICVPANESQFLETVQANVADVARFFGLKPHHIGGKSMDSMTYSNVEQEHLDLLAYPILPWVLRYEAFLTSLTPRPQYVKLNTGVMVKADLRTRYEVHRMALTSGMDNVDERRALEDQAPLPNGEGQHYLWPPNATNPTDPTPTGANP